MLCTSFSCVSWYFWYFGFLLCKHFYFQHSFRVTGIKLKSWVYFLHLGPNPTCHTAVCDTVTLQWCIFASCSASLFLAKTELTEWFYKSNKTQSLPKIPPTSNNVDISPASFASKCAKNKNKTNALTLKTALNHVNWSLGYLNSKMMCVNTDQHLRCREEASRGRCSWPVWQKADRARTPPRPERQKTSWKNPRSNLKCLSSCNSPLTIREVQHRWKSNTLPFWYNDRSRVACQIHARFSKQLWLFLMNPQWGHRLIPVYSKSLGNDCESPHGFWIS